MDFSEQIMQLITNAFTYNSFANGLQQFVRHLVWQRADLC